MVIIITGASHTGKTMLAQKMLEEYHYPYLSIDHLKMGLIRSKNTDLTPLSSDEELTSYLWPIVREMVKTAIENDQNLIVEGCYIPLDLANDFDQRYSEKISFKCLVMSEKYIRAHFEDIKKYANVIESRLDDTYCTVDCLIRDNKRMMELVEENSVDYVLIDEGYDMDSIFNIVKSALSQ